MKLKTAVSRVLLAKACLLGRLDDAPALGARLVEIQAELEGARRALWRVHEERQYWYSLWFTMGREFENAQTTLCDEIDQLRRKLGIEGTKWEEIVKKGLHDQFVEPKSHPVKGIRTEIKTPIASPPQAPKQAKAQEK